MKKSDLKLKRPQLTLKGSSASSLGFKPPKFAADLYADLRDRRLLPFVALLVVAIVASPILLSGRDDETAAPAVPVPEATASASHASFSVVPAETGLRDYRRRLGRREARNPFHQPPVADKAASSDEGPAADTGSETGASPSPTETAAVEGGNGEIGTTTDVVVQKKVISYEINAKAGFMPDHVKLRKGIAPTTKLPTPKNPVVVFMGLSKDKRALFLMSSNVTAYYGKAHCALDKQACQLVELKPGKSATFAYGYGEARYKLTLRKIVPVVQIREAEATVTAGHRAIGSGN